MRAMNVALAALAVVSGGVASAGPVADHVRRELRRSAADSDGRVRIDSIGTSAGGQDILVATIGSRRGADERPAILVVGGVNGEHTVGIETALGMVSALAASEEESLRGVTVYVVPCLNPDSADWHATAEVAMEHGRTMTPDDADDDGRIDEDGPTDIDGDGVISLMAISNPGPTSGLRATHVFDADEPRLLRPADRSKDEVATHAVMVEGRDQDGDGRVAEDGPGGVSLDMNFPANWDEFRDGAGRRPLSEPEALALTAWVLDRPRIVAVVEFAPGDTIVKVPEAGKMDTFGRVPVGIESDDKAVYDALSSAFKEVTRMESAPTTDAAGSLQSWAYGHLGIVSVRTPVWVRPDQLKQEGETTGEAGENAEGRERGGRRGGAEAQAEETPPTVETITLGGRRIELTPEGMRRAMQDAQSMSREEMQAIMQEFQALPAETRAKIEALMQGQTPPPGTMFGEIAATLEEVGFGTPSAPAQPERRGGGRGGRFGGAPPDAPAGGPGAARAPRGDSDDAKWLAYAEERGEGFIDWHEATHPDFGTVLIGGFSPGFTMNPPEAEVERLVGEQTAFVARLAGMMPRVEVQSVGVSRVGEGVWRVGIRLTNTGEMPTRLAIGSKTRRLAPMRVWLDLPEERVVAGARRRSVESIRGKGDTFEAEWTVLGRAGESVVVDVMSQEFGSRRVEITLKREGEL